MSTTDASDQPKDVDGEPYTAARLVAWLRAKYSRHHEEEDMYAADLLERLASGNLTVQEGGAEPPHGWREAIESVRLGLNAGGRSMSNGEFELEFGGALLEAVAERLEALEAASAPVAGSLQTTDNPNAYCWLVELFLPGGNSMGYYHTGFTDLGGQSRSTQDPHAAKRYASKAEAEAVASKLLHLAGVWRAIEHGFDAPVDGRDMADHNLHLFLSAQGHLNSTVTVWQVLQHWRPDAEQEFKLEHAHATVSVRSGPPSTSEPDDPKAVGVGDTRLTDERARFEKWVKAGNSFLVDQDDGARAAKLMAWEAWSARAVLAATP